MATIRTYIQDFSLANKLYVNAIVTFYKVLNGQKSAEKATLYSGITGEGKLPNPQTLDSFGKVRNPIYIEEAVIMAVTGLQNVEDHDTGIVSNSPGAEFMGIVIAVPEEKEYKLIVNSPFAAEIISITTVSDGGECVLTGKIDGVALGGGANTIESTEHVVEHSTANSIPVGGTFSIDITDNEGCDNASITIAFLRK